MPSSLDACSLASKTQSNKHMDQTYFAHEHSSLAGKEQGHNIDTRTCSRDRAEESNYARGKNRFSSMRKERQYLDEDHETPVLGCLLRVALCAVNPVIRGC